MPSDETASARPTSTLGQHLAAIRLDRGLSLRQVEELTHKLVSNAYLSQIENNKIQQPSPNILHALAQAYKTSYQNLMEMAGYITAKSTKDAVHGRAATFAALNLTEHEETELLEYLKFKRQMREKTGEDR
jgi:transcriptional regulator with XRE-family HTH domain